MASAVAGLLAVAILTLLAGPLTAAELEYPVKAAFLLNFAKFTEFPAASFESDAAPLSICVLAPNPFGDTLAHTLSGERAGGRSLATRTIGSVSDTRGCQMLFVPRARTDQTAAFVAATADRGVVVIGESDSVLQSGGTINLFVDSGRVRFAMSPAGVERRGVRFSSHLLRLARNHPAVPEGSR